LGGREEESVAAHSLDAVDPAALAARLPSDDAALFAPPAPRLATQFRSLGHALSGLSRGAARQAAGLAARSVSKEPGSLGSAGVVDRAEGAAGAGEGGGASRGMRRLRGVARTVAAVRRARLGFAARAAAAPEEAAPEEAEGEEVAMSEEAMMRMQEAEAAARAAARAAQARVESAAAELEIKRTVSAEEAMRAARAEAEAKAALAAAQSALLAKRREVVRREAKNIEGHAGRYLGFLRQWQHTGASGCMLGLQVRVCVSVCVCVCVCVCWSGLTGCARRASPWASARYLRSSRPTSTWSCPGTPTLHPHPPPPPVLTGHVSSFPPY
jgi:hypothetical protein